MQAGDRYVLVTRAGRRVAYVVEKIDGQDRGVIVSLRNPLTDRLAHVYSGWLSEGKDTPSSAHWEKVA